MLRLTDDLRDRLKASAEANGRSMNAEIIARLETSFAMQGEPIAPALFDKMFVNRIEQAVERALARRLETGQDLLIEMEKDAKRAINPDLDDDDEENPF